VGFGRDVDHGQHLFAPGIVAQGCGNRRDYLGCVIEQIGQRAHGKSPLQQSNWQPTSGWSVWLMVREGHGPGFDLDLPRVRRE
jgi:hypothetical protein